MHKGKSWSDVFYAHVIEEERARQKNDDMTTGALRRAIENLDWQVKQPVLTE